MRPSIFSLNHEQLYICSGKPHPTLVSLNIFDYDNIRPTILTIHTYFRSDDKFDAIIMGEVLEHVENPMMFLKKIYDIAEEDAFIYITTAINAPQPDHIYHFKTIDEVVELFADSGLEVVDQIALTANNVSIEKALRKKYAIVVGFVLRKM